MTNEQANEQHWKLLIDELKKKVEEKKITRDYLEQATGFKQSNISRIFSKKYGISLPNFIKLCEAVGVRLIIIDKEP